MEGMEGLHQLFLDLYQRFLLRDFAGKIIPGAVLLFSVCSMFLEPRDLMIRLSKTRWPLLALLGGLAWTITLGTQSIADFVGAWAYFPGGNSEAQFQEHTIRVEQFLATATDGQKLQYERFVVIKEACGNLFVAGVLSVVPWIYFCLNRFSGSFVSWKRNRVVAGSILVALLALVLSGLYRMHWQHVERQWSFATGIAARKDLHKKAETTEKPHGVNQSSEK
jgi:hypothetical protein